MIDYLEEAGVVYRFINSTDELEYGEYAARYTAYLDGKKVNEDMVAVLNKNNIYKLVNNWNRKNRLQGTDWYYEV